MRPITILYVEDNDDLRATIGELLARPDRDVTLCASAERALEAERARPYDIIVTDVSLPGLSGIDLAQSLLAADPNRVIVLCSGYEIGPRALQFGPNVRAITKPFEIEDLEVLIDELCASVRALAEPDGPGVVGAIG